LPHYALTWIVEGKGTTWLDDRKITTRPGTLMLMRSGMTLRHDWTAHSFQVFAVFDFDAVPAGREDWPVERQLEPTEFVFSLYRFMLPCDLRGSEGALVVVRSVELMLAMFLTGFTGEMASVLPRLPEPVERALDLMTRTIHQQPDAPIRLDGLAKYARVAPTHLCRLFRKELGTSPVACASLVRVELCAGLLERTEATLSEIAERYGYSSPFHFSRAFKQAYGVAPSEYRRAFRTGTTTRPGGLLFRHHRLRRYLYEQGPGKIKMEHEQPLSGRAIDTPR
jgi:AraC-like DNA-binding protein